MDFDRAIARERLRGSTTPSPVLAVRRVDRPGPEQHRRDHPSGGQLPEPTALRDDRDDPDRKQQHRRDSEVATDVALFAAADAHPQPDLFCARQRALDPLERRLTTHKGTHPTSPYRA